MDDAAIDARVEAIRRFNRFHTQEIGALHERYSSGPYNVVETRVLHELGNRRHATASALARDLDLDPGYLSRIVRRLVKQGLIERTPSASDRRQADLRLTPSGRKAYTVAVRRSHDDFVAMLRRLSDAEQRRLIAAMSTIEQLLGDREDRPVQTCVLRPHRIGDIGWVVSRHGVLYAREYGWDASFEAMVARVAADFVDNFAPGRECAWIAELDGDIVGSAFVVEQSKSICKLRLVYLEPHARGLGIGKRLVAQCMDFARDAGYQRMTLWTNDVLHAARAIYEKAGFVCVKSEPHHSFGQDLVGEYWGNCALTLANNQRAPTAALAAPCSWQSGQ